MTNQTTEHTCLNCMPNKTGPLTLEMMHSVTLWVFLVAQKAKEERGGSLKVLNDLTCQNHHLCSTACFHSQPSQNHSVHVQFFCFFDKVACHN